MSRKPCPGLCHLIYPANEVWGPDYHSVPCKEQRALEAARETEEEAGYWPQRITRDEYGLKLAEAAALRADCTRRQVGAVIVAPDGSIVATGYNGLASGKPGCASARACPRGALSYLEQPPDVSYEESGCRAVHAEVNAIIRAGRDRCVGATIYITDRPCFHCSVVIEGAGLARVVVPHRERGGIVPMELAPSL